MRKKISKSGDISVPLKLWHKLGLLPGDTVKAEIEGSRLVLTPVKVRRRRARIVKDPVTGWPVLTLGKNAPKLTSEEVRAALADFP